jgi:glucokinase
LKNLLSLDVSLTNDVRAATIGEWLHGAGRGYGDILCLFVGTGIGGGIVSSGRLIIGCSNNAGELGHMPVDFHGRTCHCGNQGCLEAFAGGWAIAQRAQEAVAADPAAGAPLLEVAHGRIENINGSLVTQLFRRGDPLATRLVEETGEALGAGASGLVNAFNPCRLILGGGVIEGIPELVQRVEEVVGRRSLRAASAHLEIVRAALGGDAGVVGAAALAMTVNTLKQG